jgi:hypothetical protein
MRGRNYSLCVTCSRMRRFLVCCRQAFPNLQVRVARHSPETSNSLGIRRKLLQLREFPASFLHAWSLSFPEVRKPL